MARCSRRRSRYDRASRRRPRDGYQPSALPRTETRSSAWLAAVSGRMPCQAWNDSAASSTSMPRPSTANSAPALRGKARKPFAALP